ncbi:MAG: metabolite traffic protein EboE [Noviherbaspirillum sp.]
MNLGDGVHLTYCSNIHPGETLDEVEASLRRHLPEVRALAAPGQRFGIGLRLSARAADALADPGRLSRFRQFLEQDGFYVFTLNGFPYGDFHGVQVKEAVYRPDWRHPERLRYTNVLAGVLAALLPADGDLCGSVSTVPGAYKSEIRGAADIAAMRDNLVRHAAHLVDIERATGRRIQLALEPEPCCFLETIDEAVAFFQDQLFSAEAAALLGEISGLDPAAAQAGLRAHLGLCLDLCHAAVEFEHPDRCIERLEEAGIGIFKLQISAGVQVQDFSPEAEQALRAYIDPVYLHQVVERRPDGLRRFADLPQALSSLDHPGRPGEWRMHFHVPVFHDRLGPFRSTRDFIETVLARHRRRTVSRHLEVETYTWDVLPQALKESSVDRAIARELNWVKEALAE